MKTPIADLDDFVALDPFFRIIEEGLDGLARPGHHGPRLPAPGRGPRRGRRAVPAAPYGNRYISVLTVRDREVVHWRDYLDPVAVFDALGWPSG